MSPKTSRTSTGTDRRSADAEEIVAVAAETVDAADEIADGGGVGGTAAVMVRTAVGGLGTKPLARNSHGFFTD